ncbi:MAG: peptidoglycan recognition protein family protein [Acidimicrobiia bacterium]|nr:peptidoglycan recognition protein family protein [Acidimicrobiia bacterium]NNC74556.1 N-acetylmuramoyl-L-alanine amidase [Acidimicrobiia bacterium]
MTVHHTAAELTNNSRAPALARQHQRYHQDSGWPDLAYHFLVDAKGNVYEGRPVWARGDTFTSYDPTGHFLVCAEGHFDRHSIPAAQVAGVVDVLAWAAVEYGVSAATIAGHRDFASTTCPGDNFYPMIADGSLRAAVEARIADGAPTLSIWCGPEATARVAEIEAGG